MKKNNAFRLQKTLVYCLIAVAVLFAIAGLGFMTNFYPLFYNGTSDMFDFYKGLQVFNKFFFKIAIIMVVMAFLLIGFDINKEKNGIFGVAFVIGIAVYQIPYLLRILNAIPYYQGQYEAFDFTSVNEYEASSLMFFISKYLIIALLALLVALVVVVVGRFILKLMNKRSAEHA